MIKKINFTDVNPLNSNENAIIKKSVQGIK